MNRGCPYDVAELLPHARPALLLDGVAGWDEGMIETLLTIRKDVPFYVAGRGVPAHAALEYMAQSAGAYAGLRTLQAGLEVKIGFLLGTRDFHARLPWFPAGAALSIHAAEIYNHDGMGSFACRVECGGAIVASAQLNVFRPDNAAEFLT